MQRTVIDAAHGVLRDLLLSGRILNSMDSLWIHGIFMQGKSKHPLIGVLKNLKSFGDAADAQAATFERLAPLRFPPS